MNVVSTRGCGTDRNATGVCGCCTSRCTYLWSDWLMSKGRRSCVVGSSMIKTERSAELKQVSTEEVSMEEARMERARMEDRPS